MNDVISIKLKRQQKELKYEKKMLKELSLTEIKDKIEEYFGRFADRANSTIIEDGCIDFAIEAFLLGAKYSRFGYYGESMQSANSRCQLDEKRLIDDLFDYFITWGKMHDKDILFDEIYFACDYFIQSLWKQGYLKGEKRYKLRLH
jgi:Protein of unknown function (DUF2521)